MADDAKSRLGLTDDAIRELAYRLAMHLREELGDRLTPLQKLYDEGRDHDGVRHDQRKD